MLATKIKEGKANPEEIRLYFGELKGKVDDLNQYLSSLEDKNI